MVLVVPTYTIMFSMLYEMKKNINKMEKCKNKKNLLKRKNKNQKSFEEKSEFKQMIDQ